MIISASASVILTAFNSPNKNVSSTMIDIPGGDFRNGHEISTDSLDVNTRNVDTVIVTIDDSHVGGDLFNANGGNFNNTRFNITNNNIYSPMLAVSSGTSVHVPIYKATSNTIGGNLCKF